MATRNGASDLRGIGWAPIGGHHHSDMLYENQLITVWAESEPQPPAFPGIAEGGLRRVFCMAFVASTPNHSDHYCTQPRSSRTIVPSGRVADTKAAEEGRLKAALFLS